MLGCKTFHALHQSSQEEFGEMFFNLFILPRSLPRSLSNATHALAETLFFIVSFWCPVISEPSPSRNSGGFVVLDLELTFPISLSLFGMPHRWFSISFLPLPPFIVFLLTLLWTMSRNIAKCLRCTTARASYKVEETLGCSSLLVASICSLNQVSKGHSPTVVLAPVFVHSEIQTGMQWKYNAYLYVEIQ